MNLVDLSETYKRIESLLALALRKAANGAAAFFIASNHKATENPAPIGPIVNPSWSGPSFTPRLGTSVKLRLMMTTTIAGTSSVAGEQVQFSILKNGVPLVGSPVANVEIGATHGFANATLIWEDTGLVPGTPIPGGYGIQATNITTPAHTLAVAALNAAVETEEAT